MGGRIAFSGWSDASLVGLSIIKEVATRHGIRLPYNEGIGSPEGCKAVLAHAGFVETHVVVEPAGSYVPSEEVEQGWDKWLKNPMVHPFINRS